MVVRDKVEPAFNFNIDPITRVTYRILTATLLVFFLVAPGLGCDIVEAPEEAEIYLSAWESGDYEQMCSYIEEPEGEWVSSMSSFPVPIKATQIKNAKLEDGELVVTYTVEMPDLGSIMGAVGVVFDPTYFFSIEEIERIRIDQVASASVAAGCGTWRIWEDTLRLVNTEDGYKIRTSTDKSQPSNRIAVFIRCVGAHIMAFNLAHPDFGFEDHTGFLLANYAMAFDMDPDDKSELEELHSRAISQLEGFLDALRLSIAVSWKVYSNTEYGYCIEYPPDWTLAISDSEVMIKSPSYQKYAAVTIKITDVIDDWIDLALYVTILEKESQDDCTTMLFKKVIYQGREVGELVRSCVSSEGAKYRVKGLFLLESNHTYNLQSLVLTSNYAYLCWTLDRILASFRLVESSLGSGSS